ncbi:hypothetical protein V8C86DRAFT_2517558, partial [Haematococcus lacustris]
MDPTAAQYAADLAATMAQQHQQHQHQQHVVDYTQGHMTMDPDSMAAAAQQLEAIQAAIAAANAGQPLGDQAAVSALEQMAANGSKNDDFSAYFAAVAAGAASEGLNGMGLNGMGGDMGDMGDMGDSQGSDKPLTSKYRGVCWNKKNRRWQAAINSSGKYIYLGSYVQEDEAARAFDRAAIRLRGNRAKLNYSLSDYMDENGQLIDDPRLSAHLNSVLHKGDMGKCNKVGDGVEMQGLLGLDTNRLLLGPALPQHILSIGSKCASYPYTGGLRHNYGVVDIPEGCALVAHIPGDDDAFAVLYSGPPGSGSTGGAVWDGNGVVDLGIFDSDKDARQAAGTVLKLCMYQRRCLPA